VLGTLNQRQADEHEEDVRSLPGEICPGPYLYSVDSSDGRPIYNNPQAPTSVPQVCPDVHYS
jgi:hypothetical protein